MNKLFRRCISVALVAMISIGMSTSVLAVEGEDQVVGNVDVEEYDSNPNTVAIYDESKTVKQNVAPRFAIVVDAREIRNVRKDLEQQYYFPNSPLDTIIADGPSSISSTYTEYVEAKYSNQFDASHYNMTASFGHEYSKSKSMSRTVNVTVPSRQKLKIKLFGLYNKFTYDVYEYGSKKGTNIYYEPAGLKYTLEFSAK